MGWEPTNRSATPSAPAGVAYNSACGRFRTEFRQGEAGVAYTCEGRTKSDVIIYAHNDLPVGSPAIGSGLPSYALPVQVTIEPDAEIGPLGDKDLVDLELED